METIYQVPLLLEEEGLLKVLQKGLALDKPVLSPGMVEKGRLLWDLWKRTVIPDRHLEPVSIVLVGKYVALDDAYLSVRKSLEHSAMRCRRKLILASVDSEHLERDMQQKDPTKYHNAWKAVCEASAILVPGGFGSRGVEGMIEVTQWARERKVPFFGICLGLQVAVIEYARNVLGHKKANSEEIAADAEHRVVIFMPEGSREHVTRTGFQTVLTRLEKWAARCGSARARRTSSPAPSGASCAACTAAPRPLRSATGTGTR
jgi:CTP synthase